MTYNRVVDSQIDVESPVDEGTWTQFRDNQDDFDTRIGALGDSALFAVNNSVRSSAIDAAGNPNYISAGAGLSVDVDGSGTTITMVIAGNERTITTNINVGSLTANSRCFIYAEEDGDSPPTLGHEVDITITYNWIAPTAPSAGDHWFDLSTNTMKRWSGSVWEAKERIFIGLAKTGAASVDWVLNFANGITPYERRRWFGDGSAGYDESSGDNEVTLCDQFTYLEITGAAAFNDPVRRRLVIFSQGPVIIDADIDAEGHGPNGIGSTVDVSGSGVGVSCASGVGGAGAGSKWNGGATDTAAGFKRFGGAYDLGYGGGVNENTGGGADGGAGDDSDYAARSYEEAANTDLEGNPGNAGNGGTGGQAGPGLLIVAPELWIRSGATVKLGGQQSVGQNGGGGGGCLVHVGRFFDNDGTVSVIGGIGNGAPRGGEGGDGTISEVKV